MRDTIVELIKYRYTGKTRCGERISLSCVSEKFVFTFRTQHRVANLTSRASNELALNYEVGLPSWLGIMDGVYNSAARGAGCNQPQSALDTLHTISANLLDWWSYNLSTDKQKKINTFPLKIKKRKLFTRFET